VTTNSYNTVIGKYNKATVSGSGSSTTYTNVGDYAFIIGNGTADTTAARSNALTVDWSGNLVTAGTINCGTGLCVPSPNITNLTFNQTSSSYVEVTVSTASPATWGITAWASDKRLKKNIGKTDTTALPLIDAIEISKFDWKDEKRGHVPVGIVADQLQEIIPEAVLDIKQGEGSEYETLKQIDANKLVPYCIKAIQELNAKVWYLERKLAEVTP